MKTLTLGILMSGVSAIGYSQTNQYQYKVDFFCDTILVDANNKTIGKQKKDFFGNTIIVDQAGKKITEQKKDFFHQTILEDESGRKLGQKTVDFSEIPLSKLKAG